MFHRDIEEKMTILDVKLKNDKWEGKKTLFSQYYKKNEDIVWLCEAADLWGGCFTSWDVDF